MMIKTREELIKHDNEAKQSGFEKWFNNPMTEALISIIPSTENSEVFKVLLQACFEAGYDYGASANAALMIKAILSKPNKE